MCFFEVHSRFTCSIFMFTIGSREGVYVNSRFTFNRFSCTHSFARLCLAPHLWWGQKPLMLFSVCSREPKFTGKERMSWICFYKISIWLPLKNWMKLREKRTFLPENF